MAIRPTFLGFEASKSGLFASQKGMDIVGNNLSNATTEGYTRQRIVQRANSAGDYITRYKTNQVTYAGMGVTVEGVEQLRSKQLDQHFRNQYANSGYYDKASDMLSQMESVLQEIDEGKTGNGYSLRNSISEIYNALQDFSSNANSIEIAGVVANSFSNICDVLNQKYAQLESLETTFKDEFKSTTDRVNEIFKEISVLNDRIENSMIANQYTGIYGPNELKDQRNLLIDELSMYGQVKVTDISDIYDPKKDTVGGVKVEFNGQMAVHGKDYDRLMLQTINGNTEAHWRSSGEVMNADTGGLKSYLDILNGNGPNPINETDTRQRGFPYYKDKLDAFAQTLADTFNNIIPVVDDTVQPPTDKLDEYGNPLYRNFIGASNAQGTVLDFEHVTAKNISTSNALRMDPSYLIYDPNSSENNYVLKMVDQLSNQPHKFDGQYNDFTGTFEAYISDYTTTLGNDISLANTNLEASLVITQEILNTRDSIMGVSETEETTSMLVYNRAFQAAARMMTTMDDMLDIIVNQIGAAIA
ncbi:MAG: flagellar hook-associated protein FlgK [Oscillospiraceae bacterium]|jgi:flagellar hook-associated protein 1 FlgK|nr:flagellar hook-associated protein FlgK [Oscillospiraceae bacterium]